MAGACCASSAIGGVGRLRPWEWAAVGLRTTGIAGIGHWDTASRWHPYKENYRDIEWRSELWTMIGLGKRASLFARLPWQLNYRAIHHQEAFGFGLADMEFGGRFEAIQIGQFANIPALALSFSVNTPTGRDTQHAKDPLGADVTARGGWIINLGLSLEQTFSPGFLRLDVGISVPLPFRREDIQAEQRFGISLQALLIGGWEIHHSLVLSLMLRLLWEEQLHLDNLPQAGSERFDLGIALALAWSFHPHWTLQASLDTGLFADFLGHNQLARITASLGLRYAFF